MGSHGRLPPKSRKWSDVRDADARRQRRPSGHHLIFTNIPSFTWYFTKNGICPLPHCPRGTRQLGGKRAGRSDTLGGVTSTCRVTVLPCSNTTALPYDVWRWACLRAAQNKQKNPDELRHPNCNRRSATIHSRKPYPSTGAYAH